jgi:YVTN family beta-propeller protein
VCEGGYAAAAERLRSGKGRLPERAVSVLASATGGRETVDFRILGSLEVLEGERVLDVGGGKQRSVLALLLLHANEVVPTDRLIDDLWPNEAPPSAAKIVQVHVSRLRKALDGAGEGILLTRGHGYELRLASGELDLDRFRRLLEDGRTSLAANEPDKAAETLREALALWRGPPLSDFTYESFAQEEIGRLEELHLAALEERIEADLALGRHDAVVQELAGLVAGHPLRERLRGQLMLALYRSGRQAEALEVYRDARRTFADELGLEPSPRLQQLERAILSHDQAVQAPKRASTRERARRRGGLLIAAGGLLIVAAAIAVMVLTGSHTPAGLKAVAADSVGVIDPDGNRIVDSVPVGSAPTGITFGRSGVWVISGPEETVTRIDRKTRTTRTLAVGGPPIDVVVGDNAVWVLVSTPAASGAGGGPARIVRIDPKTMGMETVPIRTASLGFGSGPLQSLAATAGSVWVYSPGPRTTVSRIDTTTNTPTAPFDAGPSLGFDSGTIGGAPGASGIAASRTAVWVVGDPGVIRIGTDLKAVSAQTGLGVVIPTALAVDEKTKTLWVVSRPGFRCCPAETVGTGTLTRIDTATNTVKDTISIGGNPAGLALGEDSVWIADPGTRSVVRFDPRTNGYERIPVGGRPGGIAVGDGLVWISVG